MRVEKEGMENCESERKNFACVSAAGKSKNTCRKTRGFSRVCLFMQLETSWLLTKILLIEVDNNFVETSLYTNLFKIFFQEN